MQNVTVTSSVFTKTQNGVRIKTWARPSRGFVNNVVFRNLIMNNVGNPVIIDQNYCPNGNGCPRQVNNLIQYSLHSSLKSSLYLVESYCD